MIIGTDNPQRILRIESWEISYIDVGAASATRDISQWVACKACHATFGWGLQQAIVYDEQSGMGTSSFPKNIEHKTTAYVSPLFASNAFGELTMHPHNSRYRGFEPSLKLPQLKEMRCHTSMLVSSYRTRLPPPILQPSSNPRKTIGVENRRTCSLSRVVYLLIAQRHYNQMGDKQSL
jgi:hypothetical protein